MTQKVIDQDDLDIIETARSSLLGKCWCILNSYGWPEGFREPANYDPKKEQKERIAEIRGSRRTVLMGLISAKIGMRECLHQWNTWHFDLKDRMTDDEFNTWWVTHDLPPRIMKSLKM